MITPPTYKQNFGEPSDPKVGLVGEQLEDAAKARSRHRVQQRVTGMCGSCYHAMIYQTARDNEPTVRCMTLEGSPRMPVDIESCTKYSPIGQLDLGTLARMATLIDPDGEKEIAGFKVPIVGKE